MNPKSSFPNFFLMTAWFLYRLSFLPSSAMAGNWLIFTISFSWLKSTTSLFFSVIGRESQTAPLRILHSNWRIRVWNNEINASVECEGEVHIHHLADGEAIQFCGAADGVPGSARDHPEHLLHLLRWFHTELVTTCQTSPQYEQSQLASISYPRLGWTWRRAAHSGTERGGGDRPGQSGAL